MWLITRLELLNFGGLKGGFDIEFKDGLTYIRGVKEWSHGDSNSSCKTTLLNAICWILYGRTPSGANKLSVINRECKNCRGVLDVGPLSITRTMASSGERLEFTHMGLIHSSVSPSKKEYRISKVQEELIEYLQLDYHGFCNSLFIGETSKTTKLLEAPPAKAAKLIESLIDAEVLNVAARLIKDDAKKLEERWDEVSTDLEYRQEAHDTARDDAEDLEKSIKELELGGAERRTFIKREKRRIKREFESAKGVLNKDTCGDMELLSKERNSLRQHIDHLSKKLYGERAELKKIKTFEPDSTCPTCQQTVDRQQVKALTNRVRVLEESTENLSIDLENAKLEVSEIEEMMEKVREDHRSRVLAQDKIEVLKRDMVLLKDKVSSPDTSHLRRMLQEKRDFLEKSKKAMEDLEKEKKRISKKLEFMERTHYFFKRKIKDYMFDTIREKMSIYANEYLKECAGEEYRLEFPVSDKDKFEVLVTKYGVEAPKETLSGGEKWRLKFALCLAFRSIITENSETRFGFLLLDDEMGEVDERGAEVFQEMLSNHRETLLPQVLMTVPRDIYIKNPDQVLTITNGLGSIEIEYDDKR